MSILKSFYFSQDLYILPAIFKSLSLDRSHIIKFRLKRLLSSSSLVHLLCNLLIQSVSDIPYVLCLLLQLLLFGFDLHQSSSIIIVIFLQLLKLSSLLE
jgi:hypothetical protein